MTEKTKDELQKRGYIAFYLGLMLVCFFVYSFFKEYYTIFGIAFTIGFIFCKFRDWCLNA